MAYNNKSRVEFENIVDWFNDDKLFFLVGAGFSASSTRNSVGTGKQLAGYLTDLLDSRLRNYTINEINTQLDNLIKSTDKTTVKKEMIEYINKLLIKESITLKEISDRFIVRKGEKAYREAIENYFNSREGFILDSHRNIIPLIEKKEGKSNKPLVVSLNIDRLIERSYSEYFGGRKSINTFIGGLNKCDYSRLQNSMLWKFHGCVSDFDSVVFDSFAYYKIRTSQQEAINELRQLFRDKHCIMLGVSLQDDHIRDLIYSLFEGYNMPQAVIVSPEKYINEDFIDYMNQFMSLAYVDNEIDKFLSSLNDSVL